MPHMKMALLTFESQDIAAKETPIGRRYDEYIFYFKDMSLNLIFTTIGPEMY